MLDIIIAVLIATLTVVGYVYNHYILKTIRDNCGSWTYHAVMTNVWLAATSVRSWIFNGIWIAVGLVALYFDFTWTGAVILTSYLLLPFYLLVLYRMRKHAQVV